MNLKDICLDIPINKTLNLFEDQTKNSTDLLSFIDAWHPPLIYYPTGDKLCGPVIKILEELSKRSGYNVMRIQYPHDRGEYVELLVSNSWKLLLHPITPSLIEAAEQVVDTSQIATTTRALGIQSDGYISTIPHIFQRNNFEFVLGFEVPVWIILLLTMLFIPIPLAMAEKSFSGYFTNLWNYSYLILSETIPKMPKSSIKRFVLTFWLLACTVLLSGYAGVLRQLFMKGVSYDVIDSWEQLQFRQDLKIVTMESSVIDKFVQTYQDNNEMARNFASRLEVIKLGAYQNITQVIFNKLFSGLYAVAYPEYILEDCHVFVAEFFKDKINECDKIHVSTNGLTASPYFIVKSRSIESKLSQILDQIILLTQENGLYDRWTSVSQKSKEYYNPDLNKDRNERFQSEDLNLIRLQGVFLLWAIGSFISIPVFFIEKFCHSLKHKNTRFYYRSYTY